MRSMNIIRMKKWNEIKLYLLWALLLVTIIYLLRITLLDIPSKVVIIKEGDREHPDKKELDVPVEEDQGDGLRRQILSPDNEFDQIKQHLDEVKLQMVQYFSDHNYDQLKLQAIHPLENASKRLEKIVKTVTESSKNEGDEKLEVGNDTFFNDDQWNRVLVEDKGFENIKKWYDNIVKMVKDELAQGNFTE